LRENNFRNASTLQAAAPISSGEKSNGIDFIVGLIFIIAVCVLSLASVVHGAIGSDAMATVRGTVGQVLNILNDHEGSQAERRRKLIAVVAGHFDFADMARSSLGVHWRQLTPDQQQRFVQLFTAFMEDAYLNKIEGYSGQKIEFVGETSNGPADSQVNSRVIQPNGQDPITVDYRLKQDSGAWRVYDVTVDNISITANYRNQFNRVINNQGFDALMKEMQTKRQELIASLGK
jgi:phospholipid transport system substrate-binding protein